MVFNPTLNADVAFNQPVQTPNAMEAVAGLFNFGVDVATKNRANAPKPTEDEKFAMAVKEFEADKGATFSWDRKGMREFIFKYPQFTDQAKGYAENLGVMTTSPQEVARDSAVEWFKTPEGMLAVAQSSNLPESEQEAFLAEAVTKAKQQEAKLAELERNNAVYAAEGTLVTRQWDVLKPTSKDMVDNTVSAILAPIVTDVTNGLTVDIDPELKAMLGIRYDKIDMNNLGAVLADTKIFLGKQVRSSYSTNFGQDVLPADDWNKEVFASLDALMAVGESVKDPVGRAAVTRALIETEMYRNLDENGVAVVTMLAEKVPADTLNRMIGTMAEFDEPFMKAISGSGKVFNTGGITSAISDMSKADAESVANDAIKTFEHGITPEFFTAFREASKRSGYNVVDGESYKKIVSGNVKEITQLVSENPDFRAEFGGFLTSDIEQTISIIESNLSTNNFELVFDGKKFNIALKGDMDARLAEYNEGRSIPRPAPTAAEIESKANLPEDMNLRVLNEKIATLGLMGEFGKEIQGAIGILNKPEDSSTKKNSAFGNGGRTTPRGRGRGGVEAVPSDDPRWGGPGISDDPQWQAENLVNIESGNGESWQVNKLAAAAFQGFLTELEATGYGIKSSGGFNYRPIRGSKTGKLSEHGKGLAIDLNAETNPLGSETTDLPPNVSEIAAKYGLKWGGDFKGRKDPMHFEYVVNGGGPAGMPVDSLPKEDQGTPSPMLSLGSASPDSQRASGEAPTASTALSTGTSLTFDSPEVQQIVEKATSAPDEAIAMAKEVLTRPMDPSIKALIEALVKIGERA